MFTRSIRLSRFNNISKAVALRSYGPRLAHSQTIVADQKKEENEQSFFEKYGLDDWKISAPIGFALAIPVLSNGYYVLNEETQLAACFFLFCTSAYKFGGEAFASYFEARAQAILQEHNAVEDANIQLAKETLKAHESLLTIQDDVLKVQEAHKEAVALMCQVQAYKLRHKTRETFIRNLKAIKMMEDEYNVDLKNAMIQAASERVRQAVTNGGKQFKAAAFKNALNILSQSNADDDKEDEIAALFAKEIRAYADNLKAQEGKVIPLTDAEQASIQAELDIYMKNYGMEDAELKALKECKIEML